MENSQLIEKGKLMADERGVHQLIFASKEDAEKTLTAMKEIIDHWCSCTVEDFRTLVGLPSTHEDHKLGWMILTGVETKEVPAGFVIDLPAPGEIIDPNQ
ncbi:MAG: hypothetical protein ABWY25_10810 [Paenisporosarcina sp.]